MNLAWSAKILKRGADVQHDATRLFLEMRQCGLGGVKRSLEVDVDDAAKRVRRQVFSQAEEVSSRTVDLSTSRRTELGSRSGHHLFDGRGVTYVRRESYGPSAQRLDLPRSRLEVVDFAAGDRDVAPVRRQRQRLSLGISQCHRQ